MTIDAPLSLLWLKIKSFMAGNVILNFIASHGSITFRLSCNNLIPDTIFFTPIVFLEILITCARVES